MLEHDVSQLESIINQIDGIFDCRIVVKEDEIKEVHVLASPRRIPKQLVRDIESACMAKYGVRIDHKKISIAQLAMETAATKETLICLQNLNLEYSNGNLKITVRIGRAGETYEGKAEGANTPTSRLRLVAQAILVALEASCQINTQLILEEIRKDEIGRSKVVVVGILAFAEGEEQRLVGIASLTDGDTHAAVEAVLNAFDSNFC